MLSWNAVVAGIVSIVIAGMPAMLALLKIRELHVLINSRMDELLRVAKDLAHAQGLAEGIATTQFNKIAEHSVSVAEGRCIQKEVSDAESRQPT